MLERDSAWPVDVHDVLRLGVSRRTTTRANVANERDVRCTDPHRGQPVLTLGPAPTDARLTMIMVHGRGASAEDMLGLAAEFHTADVAFLAPQAAGRTWYPYSFLSPIQDNEPGITSGLGVIAGLVDGLVAQQVPHGADCADWLLAGRVPVARVRGASSARATRRSSASAAA